VVRGSASLRGPGRVHVADGNGAGRELQAGAVVLAIGSVSRVPDDVPGLLESKPWTHVEGTGTRDLPESLVILGAGPTGVGGTRGGRARSPLRGWLPPVVWARSSGSR
jgi:pyruvate/2-oxoglutarate dehydrogenase complex dihydrolipoamide dehydrogenase (E3) component